MEPVLPTGERRLGANLLASKRSSLSAVARSLAGEPGVLQPYGQPYQQPYAQAAPNTKDHVAAGLLAIFLGSLGIHKFYLGYNTPGFIMLAVTIVGSIFSLGLAGLAMVVISIVEGVLYLSKSQTEFEQIYVFNKKEWF